MFCSAEGNKPTKFREAVILSNVFSKNFKWKEGMKY